VGCVPADIDLAIAVEVKRPCDRHTGAVTE
jgi:hypothetical protein